MSANQPREPKSLADYCQRFSALNVSSNRQRGNAHYKPILLLSVIDLVSQGLIEENKITVSDELIDTFQKYWILFGSPTYKGGLHYPFLHLQSEEFWHLTFRSSFNGLQPKTIKKLKEAVEYASLDNLLFSLIQEPSSREQLVDTIFDSWFSELTNEEEDILKVDQEFQNFFDSPLRDRDKSSHIVLRRSTIRNSFFRKAIVHIYNYTCAVCRLKITRKINENIVDGAHIKPFSEFYDSQVSNGLSLCKNHHWAFDRGWFTIDDRYRIVVAEDLQEISPYANPIKSFHHQRILLPTLDRYFPSLEALSWHRTHRFYNH
jgi:putative restriction endonuclease